jgi:endonuclease/exonuclease/phosphatase (EEP) superfamily protein YafD
MFLRRLHGDELPGASMSSRSRKQKVVGLLRATNRWLAFGYLGALLTVTGMLRFVGEDWWATCVALYLPRLGFALPICVLLPLMVILRQYRLMLTQVAAVVWILFPLMGLEVSTHGISDSGSSPRIRVLSVNADSGYYGYDRIAASILENAPDVALVQEAFGDQADRLVADLQRAYPYVRQSTQFVIASKFEIKESTDPERLVVNDRIRSPRFMRYVLSTPIGWVVFYSVHPESPRADFRNLCGNHCRNSLLSGRMFSGEAAQDINRNTELRTTQFLAALKQASTEVLPVVIGGDTNLPGLSKLLAVALEIYDDGFSQAGLGFGYTFHRRMPWMRIDRILTGRKLEVVKFATGCEGISDHLCVVADVARR